MALAFESLQEASDLEGGARHKKEHHSFIHSFMEHVWSTPMCQACGQALGTNREQVHCDPAPDHL